MQSEKPQELKNGESKIISIGNLKLEVRGMSSEGIHGVSLFVYVKNEYVSSHVFWGTSE